MSINQYADDSPQDLELIRKQCLDAGIEAVISDFREQGGEGGTELAERIADLCAQTTPRLEFLYPLDMPLLEKVRTIAQRIYGADDVRLTPSARQELNRIENLGYGELPICMAKTPLSLTDNPKISGCPKGIHDHHQWSQGFRGRRFCGDLHRQNHDHARSAKGTRSDENRYR